MSHLKTDLQPDDYVKKSGKSSCLYEITGTPIVSRYSSVLGMSKIDFTPAQMTLTGVFESSNKSAEISKVYSAPRCTPPMPPVTKILMPAMFAIYIVPATVVDPFILRAMTNARSRREHLRELCLPS